ncbi:MAG: hypothetical protein JJE51_00175 [Thermoanaerobaculia bacterium]|nr:hypothetical protein [Thermoanaerobaculia bacterium]
MSVINCIVQTSSVGTSDLLAADFISLYEDVWSRRVDVAPADELRATARSLELVMAVMYTEADGRRSFLSRVAGRLANSKWLSAAVRLMHRLTRATGT